MNWMEFSLFNTGYHNNDGYTIQSGWDKDEFALFRKYNTIGTSSGLNYDPRQWHKVVIEIKAPLGALIKHKKATTSAN